MNDQKSLNPTPPTFSAGNRTWSLQIDCGKVRKLRDITGVDVAKLQEGEALGDLVRDYVKLGEVLFILCEDQAEREGVSVEDFYKGIDPLTLGPATDALMQALVNFTQPELRDGVKATMELLTEYRAVASKELLAQIAAGMDGT